MSMSMAWRLDNCSSKSGSMLWVAIRWMRFTRVKLRLIDTQMTTPPNMNWTN